VVGRDLREKPIVEEKLSRRKVEETLHASPAQGAEVEKQHQRPGKIYGAEPLIVDTENTDQLLT
jgi:hypothetical protein